MPFKLVFDGEMRGQLHSASKNKGILMHLNRLLDKLRLLGPRAGIMLDAKDHLFELKMKRPPIRLYYAHDIETDEIYVFKYELKKSPRGQQDTITRLKPQIFP